MATGEAALVGAAMVEEALGVVIPEEMWVAEGVSQALLLASAAVRLARAPTEGGASEEVVLAGV